MCGCDVLRRSRSRCGERMVICCGRVAHRIERRNMHRPSVRRQCGMELDCLLRVWAQSGVQSSGVGAERRRPDERAGRVCTTSPSQFRIVVSKDFHLQHSLASRLQRYGHHIECCFDIGAAYIHRHYVKNPASGALSFTSAATLSTEDQHMIAGATNFSSSEACNQGIIVM